MNTEHKIRHPNRTGEQERAQKRRIVNYREIDFGNDNKYAVQKRQHGPKGGYWNKHRATPVLPLEERQEPNQELDLIRGLPKSKREVNPEVAATIQALRAVYASCHIPPDDAKLVYRYLFAPNLSHEQTERIIAMKPELEAFLEMKRKQNR